MRTDLSDSHYINKGDTEMTQTFTASRKINGHNIDVEYLYFSGSGRLSAWIDRAAFAEVEWVDYSPSLETEDGLIAAAMSDFRSTIENADDLEIPADKLAILKNVAA